MPLYTSEALVLRTYKLGETDRIVVFLTRDRGKRRGVANGARRPRSRFAGALEPLTRVEIAYFEHERRELVRVNYAEAVRSPLEAKDPAAYALVEYFAELLDEWAPEADPNERLYRLGSATLDALTSGVPVAALARYFEYWLLRLQGVYPPHVICRRCGGGLGGPSGPAASLVPRDAAFVCRPCAEVHETLGATAGAELSGRALAFLARAGSVGPDQVAGLPFSAQAGRELESVHRVLISMHLEKELKSARVVRDLARRTDRA